MFRSPLPACGERESLGSGSSQRVAPRTSSLLPLWEKVARTKSVPDEGSASAERDPSPALASLEHPLPQGEKLRLIMPHAIPLSTANCLKCLRYTPYNLTEPHGGTPT